MSRGMPSLVALLGLLAVAGYQNRDKIADMFGKAAQNAGTIPGGTGQTGLGNILGGLGGLLGGASGGSILSGGLGSLVDHFRQNGQGQAAESWIKQGPNQSVTPDQLEQALGPEVLDALMKQTGLTKEELISRLSQVLPGAIDKLTPEGRVPTPDEVARPA